MALYNGIETDNIILNLDNSTTFYNRQKHFTSYLSTIASRIRSGQSILSSAVYGAGQPNELYRTLSSVPTTGSWILTKNGEPIGSISYKIVEDQISFRISTNDTDINNSCGQIIDTSNDEVVTSFTITNGKFQLTEHLTSSEMQNFINQLSSNIYKYYFSINDDSDTRIIAAGVYNPTRGMFFRDGTTDTFDNPISRDTDYPTRDTLEVRVTNLENLFGQLNPDWLDALNNDTVSDVSTMDNYIATLLNDADSETRQQLNTIMGGVLGETVATFMKAHIRTLSYLIIEIQPPTSNFYIDYIPLIYTDGNTAPTYKAYADSSQIYFSTSATPNQFAFLYSTVLSSWVLQVNVSGTWYYVKSDGSLVNVTSGPFSSTVSAGTITGSSRLTVSTTISVAEADYNDWFYKVTATIGSPDTNGGYGRFRIRSYDLESWLSLVTSGSDKVLEISSTSNDIVIASI